MITFRTFIRSDKFFLGMAILVIFLVSLLTVFINLGFHRYFVGLDAGAGILTPFALAKDALSAWTGFSAPGYASTVGVQSSIWNFFVLIVHILSGFQAVIMFRLLEVLCWFLAGLSMFLAILVFSRLLFKNPNRKIVYIGALFGALFYIFNHFTLFLWGIPKMSFHATYIVAPALLAAFIYFLEFQTNLKYAILTAFLTVLLMNGNTASSLVALLLLLLYFLLFIFSPDSAGQRKKYLCWGLALIFLVALLNFYILLPNIAGYGTAYGTSPIPQSETQKITDDFYYWQASYFNTSLTTVLSLFSLEGQDNWVIYPSYPIYQKMFFKLVSFIFSLLVVIGLLVLAKYKKRPIIFILFSLVFLMFAALGMKGPFHELFQWLWDKVPYFKQFFKTNFQRFVPFLALFHSLILGLLVIRVLPFLKKHFKKYQIAYGVFLVFLTFVFVVYNWGYFSGKLIENRYLINPPPRDYKLLEDYFKEQKGDFKVLTLPALSSGLKWDDGPPGNKDMSYVADDLTPLEKYRLGAPVMSSKWFSDNKIINSDVWEDWALEQNLGKLLSYADLFNIGYLLAHKDIFNEIDFGRGGGLKNYQGGLRVKNMERTIKGLPQMFHKTFTSRYLDIYQVAPNYFGRHFYAPQRIIYVQGGLSSLLALNDFNGIPGRALYFYNKFDSSQNDFMLGGAQEIIIPFGINQQELDRNQGLSIVAFVKKEPAEVIKKYQDKVVLLSKSIELDSYRLEIPATLDYKLFVSKESPFVVGNIKMEIQNSPLSFSDIFDKEPEGNYYYVGDIKLTKGSANIKISKNGSNVGIININDFVLKSDLGSDKVVQPALADFVKISPTKYKVKLKNANEPFLLVFSESFHPQWKIYPQTVSGLGPVLSEQNHFLINGYANGWWIDANQIKNQPADLEFMVEFRLQKFTNLGLWISAVAFLFCLAYLAYVGLGKKVKKLFRVRKLKK